MNRIILLVLSASLYLGGVGCKKAAPSVPSRPPRIDAEDVYPFDRSLMHMSGKILDAEILGRSEDSIMFVRKNDGKGYSLKIEELFEADQRRMRRLPVRPHEFPPVVTMSKEEEALDRLIEFREREIARVQRRVDELSLEPDWYQKNHQYTAEIDRLNQKIDGMRRELERLKAQKGG